MYKVFFNDSFLIITDNPKLYPEFHSFHLQSFNQLEKWVLEAETAINPVHLVCVTDEPQKVWEKFQSLFKIIGAAGGLVRNSRSKYLFIFRRGKWDLPKGKIDKGETTEKAAIREVMEETGLLHVTIVNKLCNTHHLYRLKGKVVLKNTYWYYMQNHGSNKLVPQTDEDIEKALWLSVTEIPALFTNIFGSVKDVVLDSKVVHVK